MDQVGGIKSQYNKINITQKIMEFLVQLWVAGFAI